MLKTQILKILAIAFLFTACNSKPKVIEGQSVPDDAQGNVQAEASGMAENREHKVVVEEVMNTDSYTYARVKEEGQEFWLAVAKQDVKIGETYLFQRGLLMQNFESKEYNRVFETLYLVSDFRPANGEAAAGTSAPVNVSPRKYTANEKIAEVSLAPGAVSIADIVANLSKYKGKKVKVTGKVIKVNPMIMGKNWIHLQDGYGDNPDLTVTTEAQVEQGQVVTLEGVISLDKDFGAGYRYDYIMEEAVLK